MHFMLSYLPSLNFMIMFLLIGSVAGCLAGLLGIGGGAVVVPALVMIFIHIPNMPTQHLVHIAASTSLAVMILTGQASARTHYKLGNINLKIYWQFFPGMIIGTLAGVVVADFLHSNVLQLILGIVLLIVSFSMFFSRSHEGHGQTKTWQNRLIGLLIGGKSGLLGLGGGAITVPYLTAKHVSMRYAAGISALCSFTVAVIGAGASVLTGLDAPQLPSGCWGYVYLPAVFFIAVASMIAAPMGARLNKRIPVKLLKQIFAVFLLITSIHLLWGA